MSLNWRQIVDQIAVWQFQPTTEITKFVSDSGMNDRGQFLFYASQPSLDDRAEFNRRCPKYEQSVVLGCYVNGAIYIYNVADERLVGIKTVTAAHEMLHAAYERLSHDDRARLNRLIEQQFDATTDQRILDLVRAYDETEPNQRLNELHSIFGTEVASLSAELEKYYDQYFDARSKVVMIHEAYQQIFDDLKARQADLQSKLDQLNRQINTAADEYDTAAERLSADVTAFNIRAARQNGFASQADFAVARAELLSRQAKLDNDVAAINSWVEEYNRAVEDLNALGVEAGKLQRNLDSRSPTISE
jgi:chromosome segregation ATPase